MPKGTVDADASRERLAYPDVPAEQLGKGHRTCLIIDDSRMIRGLARRIVSELGYDVTEAENGKEALSRCSSRMPELVIVDWDMPVMAGIEFVTALRAIPGGDGPKVVFCTSKSNIDDVKRGAAAGANEWIVKPFDRDGMLAKLARVGAA
ncbi:response regulator [Altererythrobacter sp. MF3-039]|uniref:response regulator n=1 Tax=Altererythrobacter sp. MF3-039 TaxID=3252901 RepID=UPI00390CBADC